MTRIFRVRVKGGLGSGNFGHSGRPGQRGGSAAKASATEVEIQYTAQLTEKERDGILGLEFFEDGIENEESTEFYLAKRDDDVIGAMQIIGNTVFNLQVADDAPKGVGSRLVRELQEYSGDDGVQVQDAISEAVGFYEKLGFEKTRERGAGQWDMIWYP